MKTENILILILGIVWWIGVYSSIRSSINKDKKINDKKYEPIITGYLLPVALFVGFLIDLCVDGIENSVLTLINNCVNLVVVISVYYLFVFLFLKLFRKYLHPIVISSIWMLPNLLYFFVMYRNNVTYRNGTEFTDSYKYEEEVLNINDNQYYDLSNFKELEIIKILIY